MNFLIICGTAFLASGLTLFSGFGLGTLLMPAFALFFPVNTAIAMTAVVHFANNIFKLGLLGRGADRDIVIRFGIPSAAAAWLGAKTLLWLSALPPLASYQMMGRDLSVMPVKLAVALLLALFAAWEAIPGLAKLSFDRKYLPLGGALSGFFGGLSGNQGALRGAFLIRSGLSKESYIATGVVIACLVDATRLTVYGTHFSEIAVKENISLLAAATLAAFLGAWIGSRLVQKATLRAVQLIVAVLLAIIAAGLASGLI